MKSPHIVSLLTIQIQGLDKKYRQQLYSSEKTLLREVITFAFLQYNHPPCVPPSVKVLEGIIHHQRVSSVDVQQWPPYSMNNLLSCAITCPSQWLFHFGEEIMIARTHIAWIWRMFRYSSSFMTMHGLRLPTLSRIDLLRPLVMGDTRTSTIYILTWYESMWLWSLHQNEGTAARDTLQHKRGDYSCCRVVTAGPQQ
jgi:hypothetical protein